jgi:hypothetical protein
MVPKGGYQKGGKGRKGFGGDGAIIEEAGESSYDKGPMTEISKVDQECIKLNFVFYDRARKGFIERFELPMILARK